ncbi:hypothetical protein BD309DRAFT_300465 [Dichomitus squalens]|nr:hypothetical protein BD309DRAFT_300465 [Dichomitus squalens]
MSAYPSPTIFNPDSALTPPDMPTVPLIGLKRRKFSSQDEDAGASRIPVKSPPRSTLGTPFGYGAPQSPTPNKKSSVKFATKSSIPFPKSSKPAPPVVTNAPGVIQYTTQASKVDTQRPPLHPGRLPPSTVAKGHEKDGKCQVETDGTAWKTLLQREKAIVAQTLDRDLLRERRWPYKATWLTPGLLRRGLHEDDSVYHAWTAFKRAIQGRCVGLAFGSHEQP